MSNHSKTSTVLKRFGRDERGNVAMMFGVSAIGIFGALGGAIDIGRTMAARSQLQEVADFTALNLATVAAIDTLNGTTTRAAAATTDAKAQSLDAATKRAAESGVSNVTLSVVWVSPTVVKVSATGTHKNLLMAAVPGMPKTFDLAVTATAEAKPQKEQTTSTTTTTETQAQLTKVALEYEAWDYNRMYAYCFNPSTNARTKMTAIQSNGRINGQAETFNNPIPTCGSNETTSFRLYNVRSSTDGNGKVNDQTSATGAAAAWNISTEFGGTRTCLTSISSNTNSYCYDWYTDTKRNYTTNADTYQNISSYQLQTILCDDGECKTVTNSSANPNVTKAVDRINNRRTNVIPLVATGCVPGKFMYFGWEDRPPQHKYTNSKGKTVSATPVPEGTADAGGDRDYDDIRYIVKCPSITTTTTTTTTVLPSRSDVKLTK